MSNTGFRKNIDTDSYGLALKSKFEELSNSLSSLYGKADTTDFLLAGSIWKDPQDWMRGLNKKNASYLPHGREQKKYH